MWAATFFIPAGQYQLDASGSPIAGSFRNIAPPLDLEGRIRDLLLAPVNGLYGIQDPATGQVGPFNSGIMFGSVQVFLFILAIETMRHLYVHLLVPFVLLVTSMSITAGGRA